MATTWGDSDGVHLIDRDTNAATCDVRAEGPGTNKRGETSCSMCKAVLEERLDADPAGYTITVGLRKGPEPDLDPGDQPLPKVGDRVPFMRDDLRAMKPEVTMVRDDPFEQGVIRVTLHHRDRLYTRDETVSA